MIELDSLRRAAAALEKKRGPFQLFGVLRHEDSASSWDLVVSAPWLPARLPEPLAEFINDLSPIVGEDRLREFSTIATLNSGDPALESILREVGNARVPIELSGRELFGLPIDHAYILRARPKRQLPARRGHKTATRHLRPQKRHGGITSP